MKAWLRYSGDREGGRRRRAIRTAGTRTAGSAGHDEPEDFDDDNTDQNND